MNNIAISPTAHNIMFGSTIKMLESDANRVGGYLITFTDPDNRDLDNEWFDKSTDLGTPHNLEGMPLLFHHGIDGRLMDIPIGRISKAYVDEHGLWAEAILNERMQYEAFVAKWYENKEAPLSVDDYDKAMSFIKSMIDMGKLGYSSGANPNTAIIEDNGHIAKWSIFEASGTHTPADPQHTRLYTLKSIIDLFHESVESIESVLEAKKASESEGDKAIDIRGDDTQINENKPDNEDSRMADETTKSFKMSDEEMDEIVKRVVDKMRQSKMEGMDEEDMDEMEKDLKAQASEKLADTKSFDAKAYLDTILEALPKVVQKAIDSKAQIDAQINNAVDKSLSGVYGKSQVGAGSHQDPNKAPNIQVISKYDHWTAEDFSFAVDLFDKARKNSNIGYVPKVDFGQQFYREFADKALDEYNKRHLDLSSGAVKTFRAIKADEVMHSDLAGYGDEHVPTAWREQIWPRARRENVVLPLFQTTEMPTNPYIMPVESTDPTVYNVPETEDQSQLSLTASPIPDSQIGTTNVTLTAGKLGLLTFISSELQEDSVAGAIPMYRAQATRAIMDSIDNVILNGDNATSGNVNYDGGTPAATSKYMIWDGLIVNALVTNSTNALSAAAANPTLQSIRQTRFLLDRSKQSVNNLAIITHPEVEAKLLNMDEFVTMDKAGSRATNMTGQIGIIDGIPVFVSNEIALADSDGKITYDGNVASRGRLLVVNRPSWYIGYRRNVQTTLEYRAGWDAWHMTSTVRIAFIGQDGDSVSILYNIAV